MKPKPKMNDININKTYLVAYLMGESNDNLKDRFMVFDDLEDAQKAYEALKYERLCYSCNICKVIKSTDY